MPETNAETGGTEPAQAGELADARRRIAELRRDQRLYREMFEDSLGLMCIHDLDGVLSIVNPAAAQSLGFR
jgi:PAS domain-containing protein